MGIKVLAISALAAASTASAGLIKRTPGPVFNLKTKTLGDGSDVFNNLNVTWGHTGAGQAALLGSTANATGFYLEDTVVKSDIGGITYTWELAPTEIYADTTTPCNYYPVDFNGNGLQTEGFTIAEQDVLSYNGGVFPFRSFVACEVQGLPDLAEQVIEILYANTTTPEGCSPPATEENSCALVQLIVST